MLLMIRSPKCKAGQLFVKMDQNETIIQEQSTQKELKNCGR